MNVIFQFDSFVTMTEAALNRDPTCRLITMMLSLHKLNPHQDSFEISTEEIGQMVGLTRNTVSKSLSELRRINLVEPKYARLKIPSFEALEVELKKRTAQ